MKIILTGASGFIGSRLLTLLLEKGYEVYGLVRRSSNDPFVRIEHIKNRLRILSGSITDLGAVRSVMEQARPDEVYNLAAQSFVGTSWEQAKLTTEINALGVLSLLNAIKYFSPTSKFYQASTSEMFGLGNDNGYQDENTNFHPRSPYGIS